MILRIGIDSVALNEIDKRCRSKGSRHHDNKRSSEEKTQPMRSSWGSLRSSPSSHQHVNQWFEYKKRITLIFKRVYQKDRHKMVWMTAFFTTKKLSLLITVPSRLSELIRQILTDKRNRSIKQKSHAGVVSPCVCRGGSNMAIMYGHMTSTAGVVSPCVCRGG